MAERARRFDTHDWWCREVRDPAQANAEGLRALHRGNAWAVYELARIPCGWAWRAHASINDEGTNTPWEGPLATLDIALDVAREFLLDEFVGFERRARTPRNQADARRIIALLAPATGSFVEPDAERDLADVEAAA